MKEIVSGCFFSEHSVVYDSIQMGHMRWLEWWYVYASNKLFNYIANSQQMYNTPVMKHSRRCTKRICPISSFVALSLASVKHAVFAVLRLISEGLLRPVSVILLHGCFLESCELRSLMARSSRPKPRALQYFLDLLVVWSRNSAVERRGTGRALGAPVVHRDMSVCLQKHRNTSASY